MEGDGRFVDRFSVMLKMQLELQLAMPNGDPRRLTPEERNHFLQWTAFALTDELHEAMQEVGWKPWATSRHLNRDAFMKEMVDAFHFFMNMLLAGSGHESVDELASEFFRMYQDKNHKNFVRQEEGYDGVKGKCPNCHREIDTEGLEATQWYEDGMKFCNHQCAIDYRMKKEEENAG